jgi:DNA-binding transcriptional MocR family regulator
VKLPDHLSVERLFAASMAQSIAFVPGELFDPLGEMKSSIRISYSFASEGVLRDGIQRLIAIARGL